LARKYPGQSQTSFIKVVRPHLPAAVLIEGKQNRAVGIVGIKNITSEVGRMNETPKFAQNLPIRPKPL
jgi:hypothetical protein